MILREDDENKCVEFRVEGQRGLRAFLFLDEAAIAYFYSGVVERADLAEVQAAADEARQETQDERFGAIRDMIENRAKISRVSKRYLLKKFPLLLA
ncbi:hypothetical protein [Terrihabitans rhizophilus]|uniref:Uncharacterized protein n=1 Tax=Terrihabitans rhizophilus TaxID=3092662 RepID=A0ABU4RP58_9HYPH|nr:hypothetical protein [Terrihabitans sp. PJ23]MDX6806609.1 hypothetical protein [Terrihabitans sp. PJ23]